MHKTLQNIKGWTILCKQDQAPNVNGQVQHLSAMFAHDIQSLHHNQLPNLLITVLIIKVPIWSCRRLYETSRWDVFSKILLACLFFSGWKRKPAKHEKWHVTMHPPALESSTIKQAHREAPFYQPHPHPRQCTALVLAKNKRRKLLEHCGKIVCTVIFHAASSFSSSREHIWGCCHNIVPVGEW